MNKQSYSSIECQAEQCEWLDISYTAQKYSAPPMSKVRTGSRAKGVSLRNGWKMLSLLVLTILVMVCAVYAGGNDVVDSAKTTYLANVFQPINSMGRYSTIELPYNVQIQGVEDGIVTFNGGKVLVSFTNGVVSSIEEGTVSVSIDEDTTLVYGGITECYVLEGAEVSAYDVLGKYVDSATFSIVNDQSVVTDVVGSQYSLQWSV